MIGSGRLISRLTTSRLLRWDQFALRSHSKRLYSSSFLHTLKASDDLKRKEDSIKATNNRFYDKFKGGDSPGKNTSVKRGGPTGNKTRKTERYENSQDGEWKRSRKVAKFAFETGSDQAKNALKATITNIQSFSNNYTVKFVDPNTNKVRKTHLVNIVNSLDLGQSGIYFIPPTNQNDVPLVKINKVHEMIKKYTDELADLKEQELLAKGSYIAKRAVSQRDRTEKKKSATKIVTLAWNISVSDLNNQKRAEIVKRLEKEEKFVLYLGERRSLYAARKSVDKEGSIISTINQPANIVQSLDPNDDLDIELRRRHMILEKIRGILEEFQCRHEVNGDISSRVMISCIPGNVSAPTKQENANSSSSNESKESKRLKKLKRQQEKQTKPSKIQEEELDSLYSFKMED